MKINFIITFWKTFNIGYSGIKNKVSSLKTSM